MAEWGAAAHTAGTLGVEKGVKVVLGEVGVDFTPILYTLLDRPV